MTFVSHLKPESYKNILMHSYWLGFLMLIYVLINPAEGYSTSRWIDLGFFSFQPSEILRLILPLSLVAYLCRKESKIKFSDWFLTTFAALLVSYLIFEQPDLGTSLIVFTSGMIPIFLAGLPLRIIASYLLIIALIKGRGTPTTGIIPTTMETLININNKKIKPKEQQANLSKVD